MKIYLYIATAFFLASACRKADVSHTEAGSPAVPWSDSSDRHSKNADLLNLLDKYVKKGLPGVSLLVHDGNGTWVGSAGKADIGKNVPFNSGTVSKVASITKLFMGALTFKLMEDSVKSGIGFGALNEPIARWLPEKIIRKLPNGHLITLGQCMRHETGVPDLIEEDAFYLAVLNTPGKRWHAEELLDFIDGEPATFAPGTSSGYSNTNTLLVSMVLEYATGRKHNELLTEYILRPLNLTNTFYQPYDNLPGYTSQGYFDLYNNSTLVNVSNLITGSGSGFTGLFSNVFDLFTFIDALLLKKTLLKSSSLSLMLTTGKRDINTEYGYGIMKDFLNSPVGAGYGHSGGELGYSSNLFYFPAKQVTMVFVVNYGTNSESKLIEVFNEFQDELNDILAR